MVKKISRVFKVMALVFKLIKRHRSLKIWEAYIQSVYMEQTSRIGEWGLLTVEEEGPVDVYSMELPC